MDYSAVFLSVQDQMAPVYAFTSAMAMVIAFAAIVTTATRATYSGQLAAPLKMVTASGLLALTIAFFPDWMALGQSIAYGGLETVGVNPRESHRQFGELIAGSLDDEELTLGTLWREGGLRSIVIYGATFLLGWFSWSVMWLAWVVQQFALVMGIAVAPLMLSLILLEPTRGIGIRFTIGIAALALLPLGWAILDLGNKILLNWAANDDIYVLGDDQGLLAGIQTLAFIVILSLYNIASVVLAPIAAYGLFTSGAQIGVSAAQALQNSLAAGVSYAAGAGATSAMAGAGPVGIAGATSAAGGAGMVSGAMGSGGLMVPAAIGSLAIMASTSSTSPSSAARDGDVNQQAADIAARYKK